MPKLIPRWETVFGFYTVLRWKIDLDELCQSFRRSECFGQDYTQAYFIMKWSLPFGLHALAKHPWIQFWVQNFHSLRLIPWFAPSHCIDFPIDGCCPQTSPLFFHCSHLQEIIVSHVLFLPELFYWTPHCICFSKKILDKITAHHVRGEDNYNSDLDFNSGNHEYWPLVWSVKEQNKVKLPSRSWNSRVLSQYSEMPKRRWTRER